jgi:hypothetical protein
MSDEPLTEAELSALRMDGWRPAGGGLSAAGQVEVALERDGIVVRQTRFDWRTLAKSLLRPPTEDEALFGRRAWIYCRQHMRVHGTGWCGVSVREKIGLGVDTASEGVEKCREWGFPLYQDRNQEGML